MIKNQETAYNYRIPVLGSLPIIGPLFRHSGKTRCKSNLVVFITPHIVTREDHVDLKKELEQFEVYDKDMLEKKIYYSKKKIRSRFNSDSASVKETPAGKVEELSGRSSETDSTIIVNDSSATLKPGPGKTEADTTGSTPK